MYKLISFIKSTVPQNRQLNILTRWPRCSRSRGSGCAAPRAPLPRTSISDGNFIAFRFSLNSLRTDRPWPIPPLAFSVQKRTNDHTLGGRNCQLNILIINSKQSVDNFVGQLTCLSGPRERQLRVYCPDWLHVHERRLGDVAERRIQRHRQARDARRDAVHREAQVRHRGRENLGCGKRPAHLDEEGALRGIPERGGAEGRGGGGDDDGIEREKVGQPDEDAVAGREGGVRFERNGQN